MFDEFTREWIPNHVQKVVTPRRLEFTGTSYLLRNRFGYFVIPSSELTFKKQDEDTIISDVVADKNVFNQQFP